MIPELQHRTDTSLRKPILRAIEDAGGKPWPKLWTTLRSTRDTELRRDNPDHVVNAMIGHSQEVAERHYLQITDEDFANVRERDAQSECVQKTVQKGAESNENEPQLPERQLRLTLKNTGETEMAVSQGGRNWT